MSVIGRSDDLASIVRYALDTTRATVACPFHPDVTVRVGDDYAENHARARAKKVIKSDGTIWKRELLIKEIKTQLNNAADRNCPQCVLTADPNYKSPKSLDTLILR